MKPHTVTEFGEASDLHLCVFVCSGEVVCEPPNNKLDRFCGTLYWQDKKYTLTNQNMLLRGCVLRNTEACYGLVIFAGLCTSIFMWESM